jgi:EmrB/QacA subfamily drug resistance transporter
MTDATSSSSVRDRRWLILGVIGLAQLMVILDLTVMNVALPSAQRALGFTTVDRQWVVTAYTLAFGSLLLLGGRLADLLGRKVTFLTGLAGFAVVSAIGGASVNFAMLITARACQGAFAALLVPSALSLLTTTFTAPKDRGRAFAVYGAIAGAGGAVGLLLGGALTQYLSWRWTLYVNLVFAAVAFTGGLTLLKRQPSPVKPRLDIPGALLVSSAVFCLVYGFSNAATHGWHAPSTYGFLAAGAALLAAFALWMSRATHPLLPPRVVLDRNRGGAYLSMFIASAGLFGIFLFLTYYLQQTLGYSPLVTGVAFLPMSAGLILAANLATIVLMPRTGPRPLVALGMLAAAGGGGVAGPAEPTHRLCRGCARPAHPGRDRPGPGDRAGDQHRHLRRGPAGRRSRVRHRHRRPATRRLGRHVAAEHHICLRRHRLPHRAPRRGPAHRPPGPDRAGAGPRLRHRLLVDRRHIRRRRGHCRRPAPPRASAPGENAAPGIRRSDNCTSQDRPRSSRVMSLAAVRAFATGPGLPPAR